MSPGILPTHTLPLDAQTDVANRAFADYLVPFSRLTPEAFARMIGSQGLDLSLSRHVVGPAGPLGFGYINRTAGIARLSAMAFVPEARGLGHGSRLLAHLLEESRLRGETRMTLEVFEQNAPALALYRRHGFREATRLFGWRLAPPHAPLPGSQAAPAEVSLLRAARWPGARDYPDIPWQTSRHAIARMIPGTRAYASGSACIVTSDPVADPIRIAALLTAEDGPGGWQGLRGLLAALVRKFPTSSWFAPQIHPEPTDREVFLPLGFRREPLNQILMVRESP